MKVCILSPFEDSLQKDSGASVRIYNLAKGLRLLGDDIQVIIPKEKGSIQQVDGIEVHGIKGFCPIAFLRVIRKLVGVYRATALYFYDMLFVIRISRIIRYSDVVQIEQQTAGAVMVPFIRYVLKRPVVIDCHDVFQALRTKQVGLYRKILETFLESIAYRWANLILVVSDVEKGVLASLGVDTSRVEVIPNGVDTEVFKYISNGKDVITGYGLEQSRVVIFVGNLEYAPNREAVELLSSKIAPAVQKEVKNAKFLVVGKSFGRMFLPNVIFAGVVDSVPRFLSASDVAVAPLCHGSGTRLKILEYLACGLPVVSTSVGAEGLDVKNGVNILLEDDMDRFASKIVKLLNDSTFAMTLGKTARQIVVMKYDWKSISQKLGRLLQKQFENVV